MHLQSQSGLMAEIHLLLVYSIFGNGVGECQHAYSCHQTFARFWIPVSCPAGHDSVCPICCLRSCRRGAIYQGAERGRCIHEGCVYEPHASTRSDAFARAKARTAERQKQPSVFNVRSALTIRSHVSLPTGYFTLLQASWFWQISTALYGARQAPFCPADHAAT